jgi:prepilin-type N-terminal cleavage/methylation domain-containing protein
MFIARDIQRTRVRQPRGLTLLEVVVGLAILSLMAGAIYGIVMGSVEATATLAMVQSEDRRVETFLDRTRIALAHLPGGATLEVKVLESEPLRQEFTLKGIGQAYVWGDHGGWDKPAVTLAPQRWPEDRQPMDKRGKGADNKERFSLAMTVPDFYRENPDGEPAIESPLRSRQGHQLVQPDVQGRFWLELLPEVERVEWRFYDPAKKIWVEQQAAGRPPLVELRLTLPGHKHPLRVVFETA